MRKLAVLLILLACLACEEDLTPPEITGAARVLWLGDFALDAEPEPFDLSIYNTGEETLKIEKLEVRGDQYCSFTISQPDLTELGENDVAFIRGWYDPERVASDQIAIEITSNAVNLPLFIIPICGLGKTPEDTTDYEPMTCNIPPPSQPDCEEI